jgi:hypothetical protein
VVVLVALLQSRPADRAEKVAYYGVRLSSDPHPQPVIEQGPDELCPNGGLPRPRWALHGQDRARQLRPHPHDHVHRSFTRAQPQLSGDGSVEQPLPERRCAGQYLECGALQGMLQFGDRDGHGGAEPARARGLVGRHHLEVEPSGGGIQGHDLAEIGVAVDVDGPAVHLGVLGREGVAPPRRAGRFGHGAT